MFIFIKFSFQVFHFFPKPTIGELSPKRFATGICDLGTPIIYRMAPYIFAYFPYTL